MMTKIVNLLQRYYGVAIAAIVGIVLGMTLEQGTCKAIVEWLIKIVISLIPGGDTQSDVLNYMPQPSLAMVSLGVLLTKHSKRGAYSRTQTLNEFIQSMQRSYLTFATQATLDRVSLRVEQIRKTFSRNWPWMRNEIGRFTLKLTADGYNRDFIALACQLQHEVWLEVQSYSKKLLPGYQIPDNSVDKTLKLVWNGLTDRGLQVGSASKVKPKK